jgi:UDP:flavonoid glycosyltransferase YjiC (YdhE family)
VPQVILPCWLDTLEFANRVEWLGIGVYGSRSATPGVEGQELSQALIKVVGSGIEAAQMKQKAKELATISGHVGGRKKAFKKIIEILENS